MLSCSAVSDSEELLPFEALVYIEDTHSWRVIPCDLWAVIASGVVEGEKTVGLCYMRL